MKIFRNREVKNPALLLIIIGILSSAVCFCFNIAAGFTALTAALLIFLVFIIDTKKRYSAMKKLTDDIDAILNETKSVNFEQYREGELSILECTIKKLVMRLRDQTDMLKKEKLRLADSLADISHQIKTPLTTLNLTAEFLKDRNLTESRRAELLLSMHRQLIHVDWLVSTLLKLARLDADAVKMKSEAFALKILVERAAEPFTVPMELKMQKLIIKASGGMTGDPDWTAEALGNIIKNCVEHIGAGGEIYIEASENPLYSEITVRDTGKGISEEDLPNIFDRFYRGKASKETGGTGIGIGLALSKAIIIKQNGTAAAANYESGGAIFTVRFYKGII